MGEKIRDIKKIKIGNSSLMVELNEGYSASQGRLIHIQNEKFRYLLTEIDFFHLSTMFMRAWSEFDYLKNQTVQCKKEDDFANAGDSEQLDKVLTALESDFKKESIEYRLLDKNGTTISILLDKKHLHSFDKLMDKIHFKKEDHPLGVKNGYKFLYQMHPFLMFQMNGIDVEVFCEIPCRSITSRTWIPLDRAIQYVAWGAADEKQGSLWCEAKSRYIYILCRAIFLEKGFSSHTRDVLSELSNVLSEDGFKELMTAVFFKYTNSLIEKLSKKEYDIIIPDYYSFINY